MPAWTIENFIGKLFKLKFKYFTPIYDILLRAQEGRTLLNSVFESYFTFSFLIDESLFIMWEVSFVFWKRKINFLLKSSLNILLSLLWLRVSNVQKNCSDLHNDWKMEPNNDEKWQGDWEINEAGRKDLSLYKILLSLCCAYRLYKTVRYN